MGLSFVPFEKFLLSLLTLSSNIFRVGDFRNLIYSFIVLKQT